ncbi:hypothetical protein [Methylibium petroleiphilum]|uniref:hypothetical protein n=1 Tax=Methylibium petroleiphilum TaxID=105560 RepID=UPI00003CD5BF|nr:hypothetical protein [Methylibium petroleiphilum]
MTEFLLGDIPHGVTRSAQDEAFRGAKVRCENPYWSRHLQLALFESLGCTWPAVRVVPWNTRRPLLVIQQSPVGAHRWFLSWATEPDFETCPLPEYSAKALVKAYRKLSSGAAS